VGLFGAGKPHNLISSVCNLKRSPKFHLGPNYKHEHAHGTSVAQSVKWLDYGPNDQDSLPGRDREGIIFCVTAVYRLAVGPIRPSLPWVPGVLPEHGDWGREADNSSPSNAEIKNAWNYTSTLPYVFLAG
jgi:hypothetical protein